MDDTDTEAAETEPLVRHGNATTTPTTTGVGASATPGGGGASSSRQDGGSSSSRRPPGNPSRTPSRHHMDAKPRLSLVPETSERSTEDDQEETASATTQGSLERKKKPVESPTPLCPFFGVRNYLHQFYEKQDINDPALYEDLQPDEQVYLVKQTDGGCSSSVFRLSLVLGGLLLLLGVVAFVVAACAARRTILVKQQAGGVSVVDRVASAHNAQVDALLLVGLVAVTLGSTVVAAALISRTFCTRPEEYSYPFRVSQYVLEPPLSPVEGKVPVTEKLTQVQPTWGVKGYTVKGFLP